MIGTIQKANKSKSGKTLSIQINGAWYTSKSWELEGAVGKTVIFEPSTQSFPDGSSIQWLNDYVFDDQATTPAGQAMDQAMQQQAATPVGQAGQYEQVPRGTPNKDAEIAANGLCHCLRPKDAQEAWDNFNWLYHKFNNWNPEEEPPY